jgi:hypothetical protein
MDELNTPCLETVQGLYILGVRILFFRSAAF